MKNSASVQSMVANRHLWASTLLLIAAAVLRTFILTDFRMHPDEALFATLGRLIITREDVLLSETQLLTDKPPFFYYTLAAGISIDWVNEMTPRLPGLFASLLTVALTLRLAPHFGCGEAGSLLAGAIVALSPFAILFSPTAFADPLMVMWWLAALLAQLRGHFWLSGLLFGLSLATKQNALFLLPLLAILFVVFEDRPPVQGLLRFIAGLVPVLILIAIWDIQRGNVDSFWAAGLTYNNPGRLIRQDELLPRLVGWVDWARFLLGGFLPTTFAIAVITYGLTKSTGKLQLIQVSLLLFIGYYLIFHWLVAFPLLDRYLLPLVPILALLIAVSKMSLKRLQWASAGILLLMWPGTIRSIQGNIPVGSDKGAYEGIVETVTFLSKQPSGTVIYHQSLGWPLAYYLYDAPLFVTSYGSPAALEADLTAFADQQEAARLLVLAGFDPVEEALFAVEAAGYEANLVFQYDNQRQVSNFDVYSLQTLTSTEVYP